MSKELVEIVRCKNCIHRPIQGKNGVHDIDPPRDYRGHMDYTCPCLNEDDYWYSTYPSDEWFCADGEEKGKEDEEDIQMAINEQIRLVHEDQDKFIFETISAYTDGVLAHEGIIKIPKKLLERALTCFKSEHPEEFMHLLKEGDEE